ncbi:MAG: hypothetical protein AAF666_20475 [Pseudomonadota bacterium]
MTREISSEATEVVAGADLPMPTFVLHSVSATVAAVSINAASATVGRSVWGAIAGPARILGG